MALARHAEMFVSSRLLVLQSKRLMLVTARRRSATNNEEQARIDLELHEQAVARAYARYSETVMRWAAPDTAQYRLIAYGSLLAKAERLRASLVKGLGGVPAADRREVMADIVGLDSILESWYDITRQSMREAVA